MFILVYIINKWYLYLVMTDIEQRQIINALKRDVPRYYEILRQRVENKRNVILNCIDIASHSGDDHYQEDINRIYNQSRIPFTDTEVIILNYICLIKHKELLNQGINKDDEDIRKWLDVLERYSGGMNAENPSNYIISLLYESARQTINQYRNKIVGRPKGKGKKCFSYNGKDYHTIQECADDYNITKQAMHKRLKKLGII